MPTSKPEALVWLASRDVTTTELGLDEFEDIHDLYIPGRLGFGYLGQSLQMNGLLGQPGGSQDIPNPLAFHRATWLGSTGPHAPEALLHFLEAGPQRSAPVQKHVVCGRLTAISVPGVKPAGSFVILSAGNYIQGMTVA